MAQSHEDLLDTVRRLIALGSSPNEHEAQMATNKAAALMAEHNLSLAEVDTFGVQKEHDYCAEAAAFYRTKTPPREIDFICTILKKHFFVFPVFERDVRTGITAIKLFGDRSNVEVGRHVYTVLLRTFRGLARDRCIPKWERAAYFLGLKEGFLKALEEQRQRDFGGARCTALVTTTKQLAHDANKFFGGGLVTTPQKPVRGSDYYHNIGREDGKGINLRKAVEGAVARPQVGADRKQLR